MGRKKKRKKENAVLDNSVYLRKCLESDMKLCYNQLAMSVKQLQYNVFYIAYGTDRRACQSL